MKIAGILMIAALLAGCSGLFGGATPTFPSEPSSIPPTSTPTPTPVPPTATPLPTATATLPVPVLGMTGEIYVNRIDRTNPSQPGLQLYHFPAPCLETLPICPTPPAPADGYPLAEGYSGLDSSVEPLAWSPDRKLAAIIVPAAQNSPAEIMLYNPADGSWKSLASFDTIAPGVYWSPDGTLLAFLAQQKGKSNIYTIKPDGAGQTSITQNFLAYFQNPVLVGWVGKYLALTATEPDGIIRIYGVRAGYPKPSRFSNVDLFRGVEGGHPDALPSPDGKWAAYTEYEPLTGMSLGVVSLTSERASKFVFSIKDGTVLGYAWSPKGDWLAFWMQNGSSTEVDLVQPDGSGLHPVYTTGYVYNAVFSPDASALLVETGAKDSHQMVLVPLNGGEPKTALDGGASASWEAASWGP